MCSNLKFCISGETAQMPDLSQSVQSQLNSQHPHAHSHRHKTLHVWSLWKGVPPERKL